MDTARFYTRLSVSTNKCNFRNDCSSGEEARGQEASVKNIQRCLENFSCGEAGVYRCGRPKTGL